MISHPLTCIEGSWTLGHLRIFEPTPAEVLAAAPALAAFYNEEYNAAMLSNTCALTVDDVVETFQSLRSAEGRPFLLELDGVLIGDADFRHIEGAEAEFAILIGRRTQQSRGLGTRCAGMMHVAALRLFGFQRIYAAVVPANVASRRMLEKLGYQVDHTPGAARFAEAADDIVLSIDSTQFERSHADLMAQTVVSSRGA